MRSMKTNRVMAGVAAVGVLASLAWGVYSSTVTTAYSAATLAAKTVRVDTLKVSDATRDDKPDQIELSLAGVSQATTADSQFFATVRAKRNGVITDIGEDSLCLRPSRMKADTVVGETRVLRWLADTLVVTTRNPRSTTVTGASFTATPQRTR